jgi:hypothetical protein
MTITPFSARCTSKLVRTFSLGFCIFIALALLRPTQLHADVRTGLSTVALSRMAAPGVSGATFLDLTLSSPTIGVTGTVAFPAILTGSNTGTGIYAGNSPTNLSLVALQFAAAPGTSDGTFYSGSTSPPINALNEIAATGYLNISGDVTSSNSEGVWVGHPSVDTLVWRQGSPAPLPGGLFYGPISNTFSGYTPVLNVQGQIGFQTGLQNSSGAVVSGTVDWVTQGPQVFAVAQTGGPAVGLPPGATLTALGTPGLNDSGTVVYSGSFQSPLGPISSGTGIWAANPAFTAPIALTGQIAPGVGPAAATFQTLGFRQTVYGTSAHLNATGQTIFFGTVSGAGIIPGTNDHGVWIGGNGLTALIARQGDAAPGLAPGTTFASFTDSGLGNGLSSAVLATVSGPGITAANNTGIWAGVPGNLHLVLRNGDSVPDGTSGPLPVAGLTHFTMNAPGEFITQLSNSAIVGENQLGQLVVVARPGDSIQVAPGDFRTITTIVSVLGGEVGSGATALNDLGQVTFTAKFADGSSGTFVSNALAVPEPASYLLAVLGLVALVPRFWLRRRKPT